MTGPPRHPALERAHPSGAVSGTYSPRDHIPAEVLMSDNSWQHCEILGLARDASDKWRIRLLWYGTDSEGHQSQFEDWLIYEAGAFREPGPQK